MMWFGIPAPCGKTGEKTTPGPGDQAPHRANERVAPQQDHTLTGFVGNAPCARLIDARECDWRR